MGDCILVGLVVSWVSVMPLCTEHEYVVFIFIYMKIKCEFVTYLTFCCLGVDVQKIIHK